MNYRAVTPCEDRKCPAWLDTLNGKSGVYIIRRKRDGKTLYVGESHTGRLRKTFMRHFYPWSGKTAGVYYVPNGIEAAFEITTPARAVDRQNELIKTLQPQDNELSPLETAEREDEPF